MTQEYEDIIGLSDDTKIICLYVVILMEKNGEISEIFIYLLNIGIKFDKCMKYGNRNEHIRVPATYYSTRPPISVSINLLARTSHYS